MIKGLAITPPVIGRISIGRVIERNGQRLPSKDDQFTLTGQVQTKEGWVLHPLDEKLRQEQGHRQAAPDSGAAAVFLCRPESEGGVFHVRPPDRAAVVRW